MPVGDLLYEAGVAGDAVEILFTGLDRGVEGGVEQVYQRSLTLEEADDGPVPRLRGQRRAAAAAARLPAAADRPGLVRHDEREVARADRRDRRAVRRLPAGDRLPDAHARGRSRDAGHADHAARADGAAGHPGLHDAAPVPGGRPVRAGGPRVVGLGPDRGGRGVRRRRRRRGRRPSSARSRNRAPGASWRFAWDADPGEHELCCRARDGAGNEQPVDAGWNVGGYANTSVQRVPVTVS